MKREKTLTREKMEFVVRWESIILTTKIIKAGYIYHRKGSEIFVVLAATIEHNKSLQLIYMLSWQ